MGARVTRWDGTSPTRAELEDRLRAEGLRWSSWGNGPNDRYDWHEHSYRDLVWCVTGSITFHTHDGDHELRRGDHIDLDPATPHAASVGPDGVECLEIRA